MIGLTLLLENLLMPLGALAVVLKFLLSPRRRALASLWSELPERLGRPAPGALAGLDPKASVWLHCASAGEVNAAAPLISRLAERKCAVVVTTATASGRERARALPGVAAAFLAPLDFRPAVSAFLRAVRPRTLVVVETELWPHMIALASAGGAKCALVNARLTERAFGRYRLFSPVARAFLDRFSLVAAQSEADAQRYRALGASNVVVCGNMKYDAVVAADEAGETALPESWAGCPVFCAGSTHPDEEEQVAAAFLRAKAKHPALKLLIAPRHLERAADCGRALEALGARHALWSRPAPDAEALVVDRMGLLARLYALSSAAFVGGTLVPVGGHNLLEPALAGVPVLFGPRCENTAEAARLLESSGGGFCAQDGEQLARLLADLLEDPARARAVGELARRTARSLQGAADRTIRELSPLLP